MDDVQGNPETPSPAMVKKRGPLDDHPSDTKAMRCRKKLGRFHLRIQWILLLILVGGALAAFFGIHKAKEFTVVMAVEQLVHHLLTMGIEMEVE